MLWMTGADQAMARATTPRLRRSRRVRPFLETSSGLGMEAENLPRVESYEAERRALPKSDPRSSAVTFLRPDLPFLPQRCVTSRQEERKKVTADDRGSLLGRARR